MPHQRFVLPREHASWLLVPEGQAWASLWADNQQLSQQQDFNCQGRSLIQLRQELRQHALNLAVRYTSQLLGREVPIPQAESWVVTGHQPELFHVGVWVKNFAVQRLARHTRSVGLNLIIDNDTHPGTSILVPWGEPGQARYERVPWDDAHPACPWEELTLRNRSLFDSFPARIRAGLQPWGIEPVLTEAWPAARRWASQVPAPRAADCLAAARVNLEDRWGAGNLELPLSQLEQLPGFCWFTAHILANLPRFHRLHNEIVQEYRRQHRLRSRTHPVADLATQDDWLETPFWAWRAGETHRHRLFARQSSAELELRSGQDIIARLPISPERTACCAVELLGRLPLQGIRLRSRALTTTLFARLWLADVFVHGIGGAKYDEMTDELIRRFYQLPVPGYATVSATLHLPLGEKDTVTPQWVGRFRHHLRELRHQPERFVDEHDPQWRSLLDEKRQLIAQQQSLSGSQRRQRPEFVRTENRRRYLRLREINQQLQPAVLGKQHVVEKYFERVRQRLSQNSLLQNREYPWVLFPESTLRSFLETLPLD